MENLIRLLKEMDFQYWWPVDIKYHEKNGGDWRVEVIIGSILTQNTKWELVEKNINFLKEKKFIFDLNNLRYLNLDYIKVSFKKRKLETIKELSNKILEYFNDLDNLKKENMNVIRKFLLSIKGIGYETADVILLYSIEKPIFVIDKYTKEFLNLKYSYNRLQKEIMSYVEKNFDKISDIFYNKNKRKVYDITPLNPFYFEKYNYEEKLTVIYKELHAMIDIFIKNLKKNNK